MSATGLVDLRGRAIIRKRALSIRFGALGERAIVIQAPVDEFYSGGLTVPVDGIFLITAERAMKRAISEAEQMGLKGAVFEEHVQAAAIEHYETRPLAHDHRRGRLCIVIGAPTSPNSEPYQVGDLVWCDLSHCIKCNGLAWQKPDTMTGEISFFPRLGERGIPYKTDGNSVLAIVNANADIYARDGSLADIIPT